MKGTRLLQEIELIRKQEMSIPLDDLPTEIIQLILVRLPVKTLSILKCVNTYFSGFVSSREFIRDHLKFSTEDSSMSSCYKVMIQQDYKSNFKQTSLNSLLCSESPVKFVNLDYLKKDFQEGVVVVTSCKGLVLILVSREHLFLWNPTIRKYRKLPTIQGHKNLVRLQCGFGFDTSNDDYKVVALFPSECKASKTKGNYVVYVYSLKRNSWIRIPGFTAGEFIELTGTFASGNLHWCTTNGDIVSFDVERQVFGTLEHPNYAEYFLCAYSYLRVLGGSISVCCDFVKYVDVWVMKEYGMVSSWTKMFTLSDYGKFWLQPSYIFPNGEVLNDDQVFDIYNPKDDSWHSTGIFFWNRAVIYVESLVPPCCN